MASIIESIPSSWSITSLEDVCEILDFRRIPINSKERNERILNKKSSELYPYYGATGQVGTIDGFLFDGEYLLLGEDGAPFLDHTKDIAYLASGKFWVNNHAHILKAFVSNKYLCYYFNQFDFTEYVTGTTRLKLNQSSLKEIPIRFAPENEQFRVVAKIEELFSELDKGVESLKTARNQLKVYRQALLKHAFEGKLTEQWRKENADKLETADQLMERIKQEREARYQQQLEEWKEAVKQWEADGKVGKKPPKPSKTKIIPLTDEEQDSLFEIPDSWKWYSLAEVSDHIVDGTHKTPKYENNGTFFISAKDINNFRISFENARFISFQEHQELIKRCNPEKGNVLITKSGTIGRVAVVDADQEFSLFESVANVPLIDPMVPMYVAYQSYYCIAGTFGSRNQKGVAVKHLHLEDLRKLPIATPSVEEQSEIISILEWRFSTLDKLELDIADNLSKSDALRQSILKKAFSGQLVPQDPNDEPASVLLERIASEKAEAAATPRKSRAAKASQNV